jgi:hypothetical protein
VQKPRGVEKSQRVLVERTRDTKRPGSREKLGEVFCSRVQKTYYCRGYLQLTIEHCEAQRDGDD